MKSAFKSAFAIWWLAQLLCLIPSLLGGVLMPIISLILIIGGIPSFICFILYDVIIGLFTTPKWIKILLYLIGHSVITYLNGLLVANALAEGSSGDFEFFAFLSLVPAFATLIATIVHLYRYFKEESTNQTEKGMGYEYQNAL